MTEGTLEVEGVAPGEERRRAPDGLALDLARDAAGSSPEAAAEATAYLRRQMWPDLLGSVLIIPLMIWPDRRLHRILVPVLFIFVCVSALVEPMM